MTKLKRITLNQPNLKDFSALRNSGLKKTKSSWVLFVDQDEIIPKALDRNITKAIKNKNFNYCFHRLDYFLGKPLRYGETASVKLTRLIQPDTGFWQGKIHEVFISKLPVKLLRPALIHRRNLSFSKFLNRLNKYTTIRSQELKNMGQRFRLWQLLLLPPLKFIQNFFFRLGFLDGLPGFAMAFSMSLHSFQVRVKLYEMEKTFK